MVWRPRPRHPQSPCQPNLLQILKMAIMKQAFPVSNPLLYERRSRERGAGRGGAEQKKKNQQQRAFFFLRLVMSGCILNSANHIPLWTLN